MHRIFRVKAYEMEHGPHFDEEMARKAVSKMENEDGSRGPHWSLEETTALANQHGINLNGRFNRYDWYVALNMIYSDFYKVIVNITNTNNTVTYGLCPKIWRQLPCEGMILLNVMHTPASTVTDGSLVSIDPTRSASQVSGSTTTTSTGAKALLNGSGDQMVTENE